MWSKIFAFSKSKVFLKYYHYDELKSILEQYIFHAITIQKCKISNSFQQT